MRTKLLCSMLFATSCAGSVLSASAPVAVDSLADVVAIAPGQCPGLDDHFAISTRGVRALLLSIRERETAHAVERAQFSGATRVAEARADAAEQGRESLEWRARWGIPIGAGVGMVVTAAVAALLVVLSR